MDSGSGVGGRVALGLYCYSDAPTAARWLRGSNSAILRNGGGRAVVAERPWLAYRVVMKSFGRATGTLEALDSGLAQVTASGVTIRHIREV